MQDIVDSHIEKIIELKGELSSINMVHKELIQRYSEMKNVIEVSYKKHEKSREGMICL
jgi:hypothetical protein